MVLNLESSSILYAGYDESNHGRDNAIHVLTLSTIREDAIASQEKQEKCRSHSYLTQKLQKRDYTFLSVNLLDEKRMPKKAIPGVYIASLLPKQNYDSLEHIKLYLDGELQSANRDYISGILFEVHNIRKTQLVLEYGPKYDQLFPIVNLADELAHYLFRELLPKEKSQHPKRKPLLFPSSLKLT